MNPIYIRRKVEEFLLEDLGHIEMPPGVAARFRVEAQESGVACGIGLAAKVFEALGDVFLKADRLDGECVDPGDAVFGGVLDSEVLRHGIRTALNLLQHLSGIATKSRELSGRLDGTNCRLLDTRKTAPGLRVFEKYAHRVGGGVNHRFGRFDGIIVKKEDVAVCGGISQAIDLALTDASHLVSVEVEAQGLADLAEIVRDGRVSHVMLDNMGVDEVREAVRMCGKTHFLHASGIAEERLRDYAETGVPFISTSATILRARPIKFHLVMD